MTLGALTKQKNFYLAFFCLIILWFFNIGHLPLLEPDEGRYSEISREMNATGDYITPRLNGLKYFEKPPLQMWMTSLFYKVFGDSEWTSRLWPALTSALTIIAVFWFSLTTAGLDRALLSGGLLMSAPFFIILGHLNILDMSLTFFLTLALLSLLKLICKDLSRKERFWGNFVLWTSLALGILTKGPVAIVLPGAVGVSYLLWQRELTLLKNIRWLWGLAWFFILLLPWFTLVTIHNSDFFHFFFIHEHIERFLTKTHRREGPIWYFVPIFFVGLMPWFFWYFNPKNIKEIYLLPTSPSRRFLFLWCLVIFGFFSVSSSKLPPYILPIWPALALLSAEFIEPKKEKNIIFIIVSYAIMILGLIIGSYFLAQYETKVISQAQYLELAKAFAFSSVLMLAVFLILFIKRKIWPWRRLIFLTFISALFLFQLLAWDYKKISSARSGKPLAKALQPYNDDKTPLYFVGDYVQSVPFYLKRKVTLVNYIGEFKFGLNAEKVSWHPNYDTFLPEWATQEKAIAIMPEYIYLKFKELQTSTEIVFRDSRRLAVVKGFHMQNTKTKK
ncbi:MAG: hypothetical protein A2Z20_05155 [Bdellovibrionales bacterium RBG_16_40_8]|nr:MAG: hypothetical protein A2Z20_05155 [Bdellovibrionales bacterium RBG_16_40_8]